MARLTGPDESSRLVYLVNGTARAQNLTAVVYTDQALTTLASIQTLAGVAITGSAVTVDSSSKIPLFLFPDGVDTVWVSVAAGPATALYARTDDRLDVLETGVAGASSAAATASAAAAAASTAAASASTAAASAATTAATASTAAASASTAAASAAATGAGLAIVFGA